VPKTELLHKATRFIERNKSLFYLSDITLKWDEGIGKDTDYYQGRDFDLTAHNSFSIKYGRHESTIYLGKHRFGDDGLGTFKRCLCGAIVEDEKEHYKHQRECVCCIEKIKEIDTDVFEDLIEYYRSRKRVVNPEIWDKYQIGKCRSLTPITGGKGKDGSQMSDFFLLSSVLVSDPNDFPECRGVYLVRFLNNNKWIPLYCGKSENMHERWKTHHRMPEIELLQKIGVQLEFRYIAETPLVKLNGTIDELELQLINSFKPKLNNTLTLKSSRFPIRQAKSSDQQ
jgi:hypothetical protein